MSPPTQTISLAAVVAFLSALSTGLRAVEQRASHPGPLDPFLLVEEAISHFFVSIPGHLELSPHQLEDLERIRQIFREIRPLADWVTADPDLETKH